MSFLDLHAAVAASFGNTVSGRAEAFIARHSGVAIVAVGGIPITGDPPTWAGAAATTERLKTTIHRGLGLSGVLTYMNGGSSLDYLGDLCEKRGHDWAYNWMSLSIVFAGYPRRVEAAFARDTRFWMSWPVVGSMAPARLFVANGSLKSWLRYTAHRSNTDFDPDTRQAMADAGELVRQVVPSGSQS